MSIYQTNPPESKTYRFILQAHARGRALHLDFRYELEPGTVLLGWTIDALKSLRIRPESLADAKKLAEERMPLFIKKTYDPKKKWVVQTKKKEPYEWLGLDNQTFKPGTVGATKNEFGYMWIIDTGTIEYGAQKAYFNELFCHGTKKWNDKSIWDGRLIFRALPNVWRKKSLESGEPEKTGKGYLVHMAFFAEPDPYVLGNRALKENWYPPANISALPKEVRTQIPSEYQYWKIKDQAKAHKTRDELIESIKKKEVVLTYAEDEDFFAKKKKKEPPITRPAGLLPISKISLPSKSVAAKIKKVLFYKPPPDVHFRWVLSKKKGEKEECPDCLILAKKGLMSLDELPTYPGEGKTICGTAERCTLNVVFPKTEDYPQREYQIIPTKDKTLYESEWVKNYMAENLAKNYEEPIKPLWTEIMEELDMARDHVKALITDVKHMDRLDKAFMVFAGAPLIKDGLIAYKQAAREVYESLGISAKEALHFSPEKQRKINQKILAVEIRLLNEGQVLEVEKQIGFMEDFMLEVLTSNVAAKTTSAFYKTMKALVSKIKNFKSKGIVGKIIKAATTEASKVQIDEVTKRSKDLRLKTTKFIEDLKNWDAKAIGNKILDEIDYFVSFWKDTVLIGTTGTAVRNIADNTLKAVNEMINSLFKGEPFWAFYTSKNKQILNIPKEVVSQSWAREAGDYAHLDAMGKVGINWWERMRKFLYQSLLEIPEQAARRGVYIGKMKRFEKVLLARGRNLADYDDLMKKKAISEVNRIFFDYSKKMQIEIPLSRIFPFEVYNIRNFNYWLKDFMEHPWKIGIIRAIWHFWEKRGMGKAFKFKDKIPLYLIPGTYFNPLSWVSAFKLVKLFAWYKGDPKWIIARDAHVKWLSQQIKYLPPDAAARVLSKAQLKNVGEFEDRQKFKWVKIGVDFLDEWLGLLPLWKKVLAQLHAAEREEWKTMFPQSQLIMAVSSHLLNTFWGTIKPPSTVVLRDIYKIMETQGASAQKNLKDDIEADRITETGPELKLLKRKALTKDREAAEKIYRAWQLQKVVVGYSTGLWLSKSWGDIYKMHKALLEEMESKS